MCAASGDGNLWRTRRALRTARIECEFRAGTASLRAQPFGSMSFLAGGLLQASSRQTPTPAETAAGAIRRQRGRRAAQARVADPAAIPRAGPADALARTRELLRGKGVPREAAVPAGRVARVDRVVDRVARVAAPDRAARLTPVAPPEARGKPTPVDETETLSPMHSDLTALTDRPGAVDPSTPTRERIFPRAVSTQDRSARAGHQAIARSVARWRIQRECANISSACMAVRAAIAIRSVQ
jgi:hypothetical protein